MRIVEGASALDSLDLEAAHGEGSIESRSAVIVGVFDGVHLGHLRLLHELLELASQTRSLPTLVTFRNHPDELLRGERVEWIVSLPHRLRLLRRAGVRRVMLLDFDEELRSMSARAFTERILVGGLRTAGLLLGYDSAIGKNREGSPERMIGLGAEFGFEVRQGSRFVVDGQPVSSSAIRSAILRGDLALCHRMLGRWPQAFGEVVHGDQRGRSLGFPTANVHPQSLVLPPAGVYAVEAIVGGETIQGVANLGSRPTFARGGGGARDAGDAGDGVGVGAGEGAGAGAGGVADAAAQGLEVHLFDFAGDLYGQLLEVSFLARLRGERRFASVDELRRQIGLDAAAAKAALAP